MEGPFYVPRPFTQELDLGVTSINFDLKDLLARARRAARTEIAPVEGFACGVRESSQQLKNIYK